MNLTTLLPKPWRRIEAAAPITAVAKFPLVAAATIEAARDGGAVPTFRILGYTGESMKLAGYAYPVIVDLASAKVAREQIPAFRAHSDDRLVGHTTKATIDASGINFEGVVSGTSADAQEVVETSKRGMPWQASIGATPGRVEFVAKGQTAVVNGRSIAGPHYIARDTVVSEISFVPLGADGNTHAAIAAKDSSMSTINTAGASAEVQAERERIKRVTRTIEAARGKMDDAELQKLEAQAFDGELSVEDLQAKVIEALQSTNELQAIRDGRPKALKGFNSGAGPAIHSRSGLPDTGMAAVEASLLIRAGHSKIVEAEYGERVLDSLGGLQRASVPDLLATALRMQGLPVSHDRNEMIQAALSNHSITVALSNVGNLSLLAAYREAPSVIPAICSIRSAENFHDHKSVRPHFGFDLEEVGKGGDLKHGTATEQTITWSVDTYGKIFSVDRKDLVNDSLRIWDEVLPAAGRAAKRKENDLFASTLLAATTEFFNDTTILNLVDDPFGVESLATAIANMATTRDMNNNDLDLMPATLLVPPELQADAKAALESEWLQRLIDSDDRLATANPVRDIVKLKVDSRLSNTNKFANASATQWYLFASPQDAPMIFAYLNGRQGPVVEFFGLNQDPKKLAVTWRVYHDFGCALGDAVAAFKSTGDGNS